MTTKTLTAWKPGMDLPYVVPFGEHGMLAISLRAAWLKPDRSGRPLLLPPAVRALDRLRAVFTAQENPTPGFIISLREALGLTQDQFGRKLGVAKMTVSRWECGRMRPSPSMTAAIRALQARVQYEGVKIDGEARRIHS
jgi:DNA-binding XRE family transcriptional regulator